MTKRTFAMILVTAVLLLSLPIAVNATGSSVCYIERTGAEYDTVAAAVAEASDGDTVVMVTDSVETEYINLGSKSLTVIGNGCTIDTTSVNDCQLYNAFHTGEQTLTIKNATLKNTEGFFIYPMSLNIDGCVIETDSEYGIYIRGKDNSPECKIRISNTSWTVGKDGGNASFAVIGKGGSTVFGSISIDNSQIDFYGNDSADTYNSMFYCNTTGNMSVNIENSSKLYLKGDYGQYFFCMKQTLTALALDNGCEVIFAGSNSEASFMRVRGETAIINRGAIWKNEGFFDISLSLPEVTADGSEFIGRAMGGEIYKPEELDFTLTAGGEIAPVFLDNESFSMERGAGLRTVKSELGIRFTTFVADALWDTLGDNVSFRTYVAPLGDGENDPVGDTAKQKLTVDHKNYNRGYKSGFVSLHAAIIMDPENVVEEKIYSLALSARCEITVKYSDGSECTFYTDFDIEDNTRSMSEVAYNLENYHNVSNDVTRHILEVCPYTAA